MSADNFVQPNPPSSAARPAGIARADLRSSNRDVGLRCALELWTALGLWAALAAWLYSDVALGLWRQWQSDPTYSHGPIVIPIVIWLIYRRWHHRPASSAPWWPALAVLAACYAAVFLARKYHIPAFERWTLPIYVAAGVGLVTGVARMRWALPPIGFLGFMIPLPFRFETVLSELLQQWSAHASCVLLQGANLLAVTDGHRLQLIERCLVDSSPVGSLDASMPGVEVTSDCSGMRMTIAIAALAYAMAVGSEREQTSSTRTGLKAVNLQVVGLFLFVVPVAVLANAFRIGAVAIVVGYSDDPQHIELVHDVGDWLVLPLAGLMFLACRRWLLSSRAYVADFRETLHGAALGIQAKAGLAMLVRLSWRCLRAPAIVLLVVLFGSHRYHQACEDTCQSCMQTAKRAEQDLDVSLALRAYRFASLLSEGSPDADFACAQFKRQQAESAQHKWEALYAFERVLAQDPWHLGALREHLRLAMDLEDGEAALASAIRLRRIDRSSSSIRQRFAVVGHRFSEEITSEQIIPINDLAVLKQRFGPVEQWCEDFWVELLHHVGRSTEPADAELTRLLDRRYRQYRGHHCSARKSYALYCYSRYRRTQEQDAANNWNEGPSLQDVLALIDSGTPRKLKRQIHLSSSVEAIERSQDDRAEDAIQMAIAADPQAWQPYEKLGDFRFELHDYASAASAYMRAWRSHGRYSFSLGVKLADALVRCNQRALAAPLIKRLAELEANSAPADRPATIRFQLVRARQSMHDGGWSKALERLRLAEIEVCNQGRGSLVAQTWLPEIEKLQAQAYVKLERFADAARLFERRASPHANSPALPSQSAQQRADQWLAAARAWRSAGDIGDSERCYRTAIYCKGAHDETWLELVQLLNDTRGSIEAVQEIESRLEATGEPKRIDHQLVGQAWELIGKPERSLVHYERAAEEQHQFQAALAIAASRAGDIQHAISLVENRQWPVKDSMRGHTAAMIGITAAELTETQSSRLETLVDRALKEEPDDIALNLVASQWFSLRGTSAKAIERLQRVLEKKPDHVVAANNLAMLMAESQHQFELALQQIDRALGASQQLPQLFDTKGWILVQMDRCEEAIPWLSRAHEAFAGADPVTTLHLASAYLSIGDVASARKMMLHIDDASLTLAKLHPSERAAWSNLQRSVGTEGRAVDVFNSQGEET